MLDVITGHLEAFLSGLGLVLTLGIWLFDRLVISRRRLNYRVHLNAPIGLRPGPALRVAVLTDQGGRTVSHPSLALIRVKNRGPLEIGEEHYRVPLSFRFPDRKVVKVEVDEAIPAGVRDVLRDARYRPAQGEEGEEGPRWGGGDGDTVYLPTAPLNAGDRFKLLILLDGANTAIRGVEAKAQVANGRLEDDKKIKLNHGLVYGGVSLALAGLFLGLLIVPRATGTAAANPRCVGGDLQVVGSTAFAPVATAIAEDYNRTCHADVTVMADGSIAGLRLLSNTAASDTRKANEILAMADGPASGFASLTSQRVAIVLFSVVVNKSTRVHELTLDNIRDIYSGAVTNWSQLGGADLPVRLVSRGSESGTRGAFERRVLGNRPEPGLSSNDCLTRDRDPDAAVIRCEPGSRESDLLAQVSRTPGAIGYAEHRAAAVIPNVDEVKLDGWSPDFANVQNGDYPFWEVEYFYTNGAPPPDGILAAFLAYADLDKAKNVMRASGFTPCVDSTQNLLATLCRG